MPAHRETAGTRGLVSASDCAAVAERRLGQPLPEPLSQAAIDALAISPTSSRSPAPTLAVSAAWTVTPFWRPSWPAGWSPKIHASVAAADRPF
jgi:hypothetical protein